MSLNHPVKFLAAAQNLLTTPRLNTLKLQLNGTDVSSEKTYDPHFNRSMIYHHCPFEVFTLDGSATALGTCFLYPFCLDTNKLQPSGTLNFSRLDSARLVTNDPEGFGNTDIYAVNYNILRIQNGMGGLMYSN